MAADTSSNADHQISVVITTRNRAGLLRQAIESVLPSPLITSPEQIIVVDDDSQDETEEVVRDLGVRYVRHARHNISHGRNAGLALAQTPYVAFLDDDDVWLPGNMEAHLAALETHPDAAFAYGIAQCATEELEPTLEPLPLRFPTPPLPTGLVPNELHKGYPQLGVVLFRQEAVASVGGSDPRIQYGQDADLMIRIAGQHEIVGVEVVGMLHRLRPPSKARSDYHWAGARREILRWRPRHVGVSWTTAAKFLIETRGLFFWHFCEDAAASAALGHRRDALICLGRALRVSPPHALRHSRQLGSTLWQCICARP
jgi:glycosyltransferase involved in cell wall biosynthesis